ncbi:amino acid ABC transporter permease [Ensifer sp. SSB1]|uniref:amino acid ABC transporter permease n=1 Tax=Ensifer sp. SSB1 TaxID=2795385 RepID=UPI001A576D1C|nr:amino acid ABC transporter permease [Ensifer sp. SSB1]MBK5571102.1 amino acid ABC transporter permease [Ensifer sp. SSB1]
MFDIISPLFRNLYDRTGWNFIIFYDEYEYSRFVSGVSESLQLILCALILSLLVGAAGAWLQTSRSKAVQIFVNGYIQLFRNTPPMVQMLFFYFALGAYTPQVDLGGYYEPAITAFGWALIALGIFGGAFNVEILRAGLEAVPTSMVEGADSLGFSRLQTFLYVKLPLAVRVSLPALTSNLVSLAKTTSLAYVISVPEVTYTLNQVWSDNVNVPEMMLVLFVFYIATVSLIGGFLHFVERRLAIPGYGHAQ